MSPHGRHRVVILLETRDGIKHVSHVDVLPEFARMHTQSLDEALLAVVS